MSTRGITLALSACMASWLSAGAFAQDMAAANRKDQLIAGYLTNFIKFVEWPDAPAGHEVVVCFAGAAGVYDALAAAPRGKIAPIRVRKVQKIDDVKGCNLLYLDVTAVDTGSWMSTPAKVLTVSEADNFALRGGMIALFMQGNRLRFNINLDLAQKAGLRIRASLLQLAAAVEMGNGSQ